MTPRREPPPRPASHVPPVQGCRCLACKGVLLAHAAARLKAQAERDEMLGHLATLDNYFDGRGSVTAAQSATDALLQALGARKGGT